MPTHSSNPLQITSGKFFLIVMTERVASAFGQSNCFENKGFISHILFLKEIVSLKCKAQYILGIVSHT